MAEAAQTRTAETQLFHDVFNASPIGIAVENLEGQPLFVNPAFCSFLGFSQEELRNKHCVDFSPREDAEKDWTLFQQLRAGVIDHYQLEKRYFRRDGSLVWGSLSISLLKSSPSPLVLAMVEDITDKKKAEEALFRHAAVIESSDDAIASGTLDGIIVSWNTGAQKIYGYTEAEAVGKPINMLVPPELQDEENKILEMLRAGGRIQHFETVRVTKTGERVDVSLTISPIKDSTGRTVGISGIARDINERKLAEEALRASEERLRLAQKAAGIGAFERNVRTGVVTWSTDLEPMYGLQPGALDGKTTAFFRNLIHPDDQAGVIKLVDAAMKSGQPTKGEWRVVWADGSVHWIAGHWQVFMDAYGEPSKIIGVNIDVTERKLADEARLEVNRTLEAQAVLLQSHEELLRIFVKHVPAAVAMLDRDMRYLQVSDRWCADFSLDSSEILGRSHYEVFPDLPERWKEIHRRGLAGETLRAEEDPWERAGSTNWSRWEIRPWQNQDGVQGGILIFSEDITHRKHAEEVLASLSGRLIEAQDEERKRIAREIHDDYSQRVALLVVNLEQLAENVGDSSAEASQKVQELLNHVGEPASDLHALSHRLHSSTLDSLGLVAGLKAYCVEFSDQQGIEVDFASQNVPHGIPGDATLCIFRIAQEALRNVKKHSGANRAVVRLEWAGDRLHLSVSDLGKGFDYNKPTAERGIGIRSMEERLRLLAGCGKIDLYRVVLSVFHLSRCRTI